MTQKPLSFFSECQKYLAAQRRTSRCKAETRAIYGTLTAFFDTAIYRRMEWPSQRNSRWTRNPTFAARKVARLSLHDFEILKVLARYRYLPADDIHALVGGSRKHLIHRLNLLSRKPNLFVNRPHQQRENAAANYRYLVYELDRRGAEVLAEQGAAQPRMRVPANFAHELMVCRIMTSVELGARQPGARVIAWHDILESQSLPDETRQSAKPFHIPVRWQGSDLSIAADGQPFGIERTFGDRPSYVFCPGIEADCRTEPLEASDFGRSSIYKKFALYLAIEAQGIHRAHFGFPNFYVPFVATSSARVASMMKLLQRMTDGAGSRIFLFKTFSAYSGFERPNPPSGGMLTEDWQRVGHPAFNFLTS